MKLKAEPSVAVCYFGDGASSEGDFHESCNFAGVLKAPVILICQNNQWAISTPLSKQTAGTIVDRAAGYGIAGVRVDGNDPLAMYQVTADARARAVAGDGPTLIEAVTYRLGAHTTADDPTRYVDPEEEERWKVRDPLIRFRAWMRATGRWDDAAEQAAEEWCAAEIDRAIAEVADVGPADPALLFDNVWATDPPGLVAQRDSLVDFRTPTSSQRPKNVATVLGE